MKKLFVSVLVILMAISLIGSMASAQSTYTDPPETSDEEEYDISEVDQLQLEVGDTLLLTSVPVPDGTDVVWTSSNTNVATVQALSPTARVTAVAAGTTDITVRAVTAQEDDTYWEETVTVEVIGSALPATGGAASGSIMLLSLLTIAAASGVYTRFKK